VGDACIAGSVPIYRPCGPIHHCGLYAPQLEGICLISTHISWCNQLVSSRNHRVSVPFVYRPLVRSGTALGDCPDKPGMIFPHSLGDLFNLYAQANKEVWTFAKLFQSPLFTDRSCALALRWGLVPIKLG